MPLPDDRLWMESPAPVRDGDGGMQVEEVSLEAVLATELLEQRAGRKPNHEAEVRAMAGLAEAMAETPAKLFQILTDTARALCGAGSAGVSLFEKESEPPVFRWRATSGAFAPLVGSTLPRYFSPCGVVLDRDALQLMRMPVRHYPYIAGLSEPVHEVLLVPFHSEGEAVGTLWVASHGPEKLFDAEDARLVSSLAHFASAAWQGLRQRERIAVVHAALQAREAARAQAASELATVRRRLDSALIAAEVGVYEWDIRSDRLYGDENFGRLFAVPVDETGGAPLQAYLAAIHPEDREPTMALIRRSVKTGENFEADYRVVLPQGERWINSRGRMARSEAGEVVSFFGVVIDITPRKRAEQERERMAEELRRLSAIHETVLSATDDFAYIFDRQGRFLYANRPLLKVWAKRLEEVVGRTCYELGYPTWHADMHMREIEQVIATRQSIRGEVPFVGASGISGIYDYIFAPVLGPDGEVELVAGTTRDVTERRRSEDRDRFLVALDDATRRLTEPRAITRASTRMLAEHLGVSRCEYADVDEDENTIDVATGEGGGVTRYRIHDFGAEYGRRLRAGDALAIEQVETDARAAGGRAVFAAAGIGSLICVPLHKAGRLVAVLAVSQAEPRVWQRAEVELVQTVANRCWESIERARVTKALIESEQQLRLAAETARLGAWELELREGTMSLSAQCRANHGWPEGRAVGAEEFWESVHPDDRERVRTAIATATKECGQFEVEHQTVWPDGSVHWVLMRGQVRCGPGGVPERLTGVGLDITERKRAERELARLHEETVRASQAKDDFLAMLSHELRTPLNPVLLLASEAAGDPAVPAGLRETFGVIRRNIELEARLIDDLLDLTTITRGRLTVKRQPTDLHDVLRQATDALRGDFEERGVKLEASFEAAASWVHADPDRLQQVFLNLLRNAVKFTPAGGCVTAATRVRGGEIEIRIVDTGIGMTPEELARVFGAFEQGEHVSASGGQRFGGLGLGLAIAKQLVELHGGAIEGSSTGRGRGSTFIVRLPLVPGAAAPKETLDEAKWDRTEDEPMGAMLRVLLVEDHEPTRHALGRLLRRRGHEVTMAGSLAEARGCAAAGVFDLLVSDIGLPDGDGSMLMRELSGRPGLRGVALTGYGMSEDIERTGAAGFSAHLTKPVRVEALDALLAKFRP